MSNQKGDDSSDGNNSEKMSSDGELPNAEINDSTGNSIENPAIGQSDEEGNSDRICSLDETNIFEIQELTSEDSFQKNDLDAIENVRVSYEFPEDAEDDLTLFLQQSRKRSHPDKSVHFSKKSKSDESNNEEDLNTENNRSFTVPRADSSEQDCKEAVEIQSCDKTEKCSSNNLNHPRRNSKATRHHRGEKDTKKPTRIETDPKTNAFESINVVASSSEGTLADVEDNSGSKSNAGIEKTSVFRSVKVPSSEGGFADVEDNADSQSNPDSQTGDDSQGDDDVNDDYKKHNHEPISKNQESTSSSLLFVPVRKEPTSLNKTKTDNDSNAVSESNTSQGSKSSATNQLKMRSDVGPSKKRRCLVCNKKLGLTAFKCRCGGLYCPQHRYDKEHGCTFDYKSMGAEEIRKNNPQIVAEKVSKL